LLGFLGVDDEVVVNLHPVPLVGPVQDVHHVLLELLVLVDPEVRGGNLLLRWLVRYFLFHFRILWVVFKVEKLIPSDKGLGGCQASVERLSFLIGRGLCLLNHWFYQGGLRLDLPQ